MACVCAPRGTPIMSSTETDLEFQALDWMEVDTSHSLLMDEETTYGVWVFGLQADGTTVSVLLTGFRPIVYVALPENWGRGKAERLMEELNVLRVLATDENGNPDYKVLMRKKFQGFENGRLYPFLRARFSTLQNLRTFQYRLEKGATKMAPKGFVFRTWERRLPPFLRLIHERNFGCAGWIRIPAGEYSLSSSKEALATTTICAEALYKNAIALERDQIAPVRIACFDIEADSHQGEFPLAQKGYDGVVNMLWNAASARYRRRDFLRQRRDLTEEERQERDALVRELADADDLLEDLLWEACGLASASGRVGTIPFATPFEDSANLEWAMSAIRKERLWQGLVYLRQCQQERREPDPVWMRLDEKTFDKVGDAIRGWSMSLANVLDQFFPSLRGDPVIQIGMTVHSYGESECFLKWIGTLKGCEPIEGAIVESFTSERALLLRFAEVVREVDPDVLTGYNIFGFDWKFLWQRAEELQCAHRFGRMGRLREVPRGPVASAQLQVKELSSSALGDNFLHYLPMTGRVQLDLYKYVQAEYKLADYKLDTVSATFMRGTVKAIAIEDGRGGNLVRLRVDQCDKVQVGKFLQIAVDDGIVQDMWSSGTKYRVVDVDRAAKEIVMEGRDLLNVPLVAPYKIKYCEVKDDLHPEDIFKLQKGSDADRCTIARYCLQDCELCNRIFDKLEVLANSVGMANVCIVPMSYLFFRGQGIKIFSLVAKTCAKEKFLIPPSEADLRDPDAPDAPEEEKEGYEGAIVLKAHSDIHYEPVSVNDFSSLYPSCMISHNLSHDSIVLDPAYDNLPGVEYREVEYDNYVYRVKPNTKQTIKVLNENEPKKRVRYVQPQKDASGEILEETRGVMPRILQRLLKARKDTRAKQKAFSKTDFRWMVLEGLQLAFKKTANSLYGQIGASTSAIYLKDIAASTTAVGRQTLLFAKNYVESHYPGSYAVYGDSVPGDTPVLLRDPNGRVHIESMETVSAFFGVEWTSYQLFRNPDAYNDILDDILDCAFGLAAQAPSCPADWHETEEEVPDDASCVWQASDGRVVEWELDGKRVYVDAEGWPLVSSHEWKIHEGQVVKADDETVSLASALLHAQVLLQLPKGIVADLKKDRRTETKNGFPFDLRSRNLRLSGELTDELRRFCRESLRVLGDNREEKEQLTVPEGWSTWGRTGWTPIRRFIRHKTHKRIYRVSTGQGVIDVTEDHSLIDAEGNLVKPGDVRVGTRLMHGFPTEFPETPAIVPACEHVTESYAESLGCTDVYKCLKCGVEKPTQDYYFTKGNRIPRCKRCVKEAVFSNRLPGQTYQEDLRHQKLNIAREAYELTEDEAWVWGFFMADGSCGDYACDTGSKASWAINNQDMRLLDKAREILNRVEGPEIQFKVLDTLGSSGVYKLVPVGSIMFMVKKYRPLLYTADKLKRVPTMVLNAPKSIRRAFFEGFYAGDGTKGGATKCKLVDGFYNPERPTFGQKGKVTCQGLYYLCRSLGVTNLRVREFSASKQHCFLMSSSIASPSVNVTEIGLFEGLSKYNKMARSMDKKNRMPTADRAVSKEAYADWDRVYDIETADGTFLAGVGSVLTLQTDSVFLHFDTKYPADHPLKGEKMRGLDAVFESMRLSQEAGEAVSKLLPHPHSWEFEKTIYPFLLLSKKRYCGAYFTQLDNPNYYINSMGIVLKRRDNAMIVKHIYGGVVKTLMRGIWDEEVQKTLAENPGQNPRDLMIVKALDFVRTETQKVLRGQFDMSYFSISKTLRAHYDNPDLIPHAILAHRMAERDPGSAPAANERLSYVFVENAGATRQGDRIETPAYIESRRLKIDYKAYVEDQISKPVSEIFGLALESLPGYDPRVHKLDAAGGDDDKVRELRTKWAKKLIFDSILLEHHLQQTGQKRITSFFTKK